MSRWAPLEVRFTSRPSSFVGLHPKDSDFFFGNFGDFGILERGGGEGFCRVLEVKKQRNKEENARKNTEKSEKGQENDGNNSENEEEKPYFLGFSGLHVFSRGFLELSEIFGKSLGLSDRETVICRGVSPYSFPQPSGLVLLRPVSEEDWKVVEGRAGFLEENLLRQVGVVNQGGPFPVWPDYFSGKPVWLEWVNPEKVLQKWEKDVKNEEIRRFCCLKLDMEICIESRKGNIFEKKLKKDKKFQISNFFLSFEEMEEGIDLLIHPEDAKEGEFFGVVNFFVKIEKNSFFEKVEKKEFFSDLFPDFFKIKVCTLGVDTSVEKGKIKISPLLRDFFFGCFPGNSCFLKSVEEAPCQPQSIILELIFSEKNDFFNEISEKEIEKMEEKINKKFLKIVENAECLSLEQGGRIRIFCDFEEEIEKVKKIEKIEKVELDICAPIFDILEVKEEEKNIQKDVKKMFFLDFLVFFPELPPDFLGFLDSENLESWQVQVKILKNSKKNYGKEKEEHVFFENPDLRFSSPFFGFIPDFFLEKKFSKFFWNVEKPREKLIPSYRKIGKKIYDWLLENIFFENSEKNPKNLENKHFPLLLRGGMGAGKSVLFRQVFYKIQEKLKIKSKNINPFFLEIDCDRLASSSEIKFKDLKSFFFGIFFWIFKFSQKNSFFFVHLRGIDSLLRGGEREGTETLRALKLSKILKNIFDEVSNFSKKNVFIKIAGEGRRDDPLLLPLFPIFLETPKIEVKDKKFLGVDCLEEGLSLADLIKKKNEKIGEEIEKNIEKVEEVEEVGGLDFEESEIMGAIHLPSKFPFLCGEGENLPKGRFLNFKEKRGKKADIGAFLVGPSGCGKTSLALQILKKSEKNGVFTHVTRGPEILSKFIGGSEEGVRKIFEKGALNAPSILFFDEIESLCPRRGSDSSGVTDRVVNQFLTFLDGVEKVEGRIFVICASSRPDLVDPALTRPGRIDQVFLCDFPGKEARKGILKTFLKVFEVQFGDEKVDHLEALLPQGVTGADIRGAFVTAKIEAQAERGGAGGDIPFTVLERVVSNLHPSTHPSDFLKSQKLFRPYRKGGKAPVIEKEEVGRSLVQM